MENKELEQVTTTEKKTKPKDPGRIAAGKRLAEHNKKVREAKKAGREKEIPKENKDEIPKENNQEGSFSLTQNSFSGQYCCFSCRIILQEKRVDELCSTLK